MNGINIEELKKRLQQGTFYYNKSNLLVKGKAYSVVSYKDTELIVWV